MDNSSKKSVKDESLSEKKKSPAKDKVEQKNDVKNIIGLSLKYPNPITQRLEKRMPQIFVKSKDEKTESYSRMCPLTISDRRQPIILTKEEKDKMVNEHPNEFNEETDFIQYGVDDDNNKFYYTCPKYWCLLTEKVVTEQDILDGKCGPKVSKIEDAIIPKEAREVPEGKYVYQFYEKNDDKNYPGFHKKSTPSGLCIPCCFKNYNTDAVKNRRDSCQGKNANLDKEDKPEEPIREKDAQLELYIKGPERYGPNLGQQRWGWLPISIEFFLKQLNASCQDNNPKDLKPNRPCLLRFGVEDHPTQSFIACIASVLFYGETAIPTIKEMKQRIIDSLNLDNFIKYQNGDLITTFANPDLKVNISNYSNTKLYKKMIQINSNVDNNKSGDFIKKVAQSFEHFKNFLLDDQIKIDHTYLWDIVCMPNPNLFTKGTNLIILEITENDPTNNVELLCPTNHYSSHIYDNRKQSILLIKREDYFEPVYSRRDGKKIKIIKTFLETDTDLPDSLRNVFEKIIGPTLGNKCKPMASIREYRLKQPPLLDTLIEELNKKEYVITKQVLNYQGKVIGVFAKKKKLEGFIPCYPSALTTLKNDKKCNTPNCEYDFVYMDDDIWKPYEETLEFLKTYYECTNCFYKVVEDSHVIGFLTNTDQFVTINKPVPISNVSDVDDINTIEHNNLLVADTNILTNSSQDNERVEYIKRIQLEANFYNVFRNTVRILLNQNTNNQKREELKKICDQRNILYTKQLKSVIKLLKNLIDGNIVFASGNKLPYKSNNIDDKDIYSCILRTKDKCEQPGSICRVTKKGCTLVLPKNNLLNQTDNEKFYYNRMADELIRYNKIKTFIFKPQGYLSFGQVKYNLRDDEIILLQDNITQEYFKNLIPSEINEYAKYNTFDTANPINTVIYNNNIDYEMNIDDKNKSDDKNVNIDNNNDNEEKVIEEIQEEIINKKKSRKRKEIKPEIQEEPQEEIEIKPKTRKRKEIKPEIQEEPQEEIEIEIEIKPKTRKRKEIKPENEKKPKKTRKRKEI
jgi:hypothetical protein